jgi:hypothetical protein
MPTPELPLDQPVPATLAPGEVDRFAAVLQAGRQYRIDILGERHGGTLGGLPTLGVFLPAHPELAWRGDGALSRMEAADGLFYFTPRATGLHEFELHSDVPGSYAVAIRSASPWNPLQADAATGGVWTGSAQGDLIQPVAAVGLTNDPAAIVSSTLDGGDGFDIVVLEDFWNLLPAPGGALAQGVRPGPPLDSPSSTPSSEPQLLSGAADPAFGSIQLTNIEAVELRGRIHYILSAEAATVARLYEAALDRAADPQGMAFYSLLLQQGITTTQIAAGFMASPEFQGRYGGLDDANFVAQLYRNVLGREGDAQGTAFYLEHLGSGAMSREAVLVGFAGSPENQQLTAHYILQV